MNQGVIVLDFWHIGIAIGLVAIAGIVSLLLRLRLEKQLTIASVRCVVQLLLIGYVLRWVFRVESPSVLMAVLVVMIGAASHAALERAVRRYPGAFLDAFLTLLATGFGTVFLVTRVIIDVHPWYHAQYIIPLLGMILGNSLTAVSLCLDHLLEGLQERRAAVEMELALGASRWEAAREPLAMAVRRGMVPTINAMMVVGLVSLPGMMTGQILSGTDPVIAVRYQIMVMFMLTASTALSCIAISYFACHRLFNDRHQLRIERLIRRP